MQNWAGTYTFQAATVERPTTVAALAAIVAAAPRVHALGSRHCFHDIADSPGGVLVSTEHLDRVVRLDTAAGRPPTVTVEAGISYAELGPVLHAAGYALANLASLPHISVAGACATATHGSGEGNGNLATSVAAMDFVTADGTLRTVRRGDANDGAAFAGCVVHLGALGVVARLTLDLVPTFDVAQFVYERVPMSGFVENVDAIAASAYSVSVFTDWQADTFNQVWMKTTAGRPHFDLTTLGGTAATHDLHPIERLAEKLASEGSGASACTPQCGVAGPWHERLCHFRTGETPSSGEEMQSEFFVDRQHAAAAIAAISALRADIDPLVQVSEIRFIAADELWLSPNYRRPSLALHFTWYREPARVTALLPKIEAALAPFAARPHWGKIFTMPAKRLLEVVPQAAAFTRLRRAWDPSGKFLNPYLARCGLDA